MGFVIAYKTVEQCVFPNETTQSGPLESEGMGGIDTLPDFEIYVNPITARGVADYAHHNTICSPPPDFQTFRRL